MNQHLSRDQISKCLIGDGSPQETQHVWECAACSGRTRAPGIVLLAVSRFDPALERWSERHRRCDPVEREDGSRDLEGPVRRS